MSRRDPSTTATVLASGGRLPVLALRRDARDGELLRSLLASSSRVDIDVVGPDGLVRTPLRWPSDPRAVPLALCLVVRDRPGTLRAVDQLVRHLRDLPVVAVLDGVGRRDGVFEEDRAFEEDGAVVGGATTVATRPGSGGRSLADALVSIGVDDVVVAAGLTGPVLEHAVVAAIDRRDRGVLHLGEPTSIVGARHHLSA